MHKIETHEYTQAKTTLLAYQAPASFSQTDELLTDAEINIKQNGCKVTRKYTDKEVIALAKEQTAPLKGDYMVRLVGAGPDEIDLSRSATGDMHTTWITTFEQLSSYDKDPRLLTAALGIPYDETRSYSLLIMKDVGEFSTDMTKPQRIFSPNFENLTEVAKGEPAFKQFLDTYDIPADALDDVMNAEYQKTFAESIPKVKASLSGNYWKPWQVEEVLNDMDVDNTLVMARYGMDTQYGASEHYLGNGTTKYMGEGAENGVLEYMLYDDTGLTLQHLMDNGQLHIVGCEPIKACSIVGVE